MSYAMRVEPGHEVRLRDCDPCDVAGLHRHDADQKTEELGKEVAELADLLFAAGMHSLLVVLQGRDTAGKDGAIRGILTHVNAQSCRVVPFKVPIGPEIEHDFLWRVHAQVPGRGSIALFNRSHYEDVLVVRVHDLAPSAVWQKRYEHINAFERLLLDNRTILVKLFLHISREEQKERLLEREAEAEKFWKLNVGDWKDREFWDEYDEAYEDVLRKCSTDQAPWHVIPADRKWFRDLAVLDCIARALRPCRDEWMKHLRVLGRERRAELEAYRSSASA